VRHIALVRERLAAREEEAREEVKRQGRLFRYLGVLVPLALLLVLW
jgi:stage III sporulation protein AB